MEAPPDSTVKPESDVSPPASMPMIPPLVIVMPPECTSVNPFASVCRAEHGSLSRRHGVRWQRATNVKQHDAVALHPENVPCGCTC